MFIPDLIFSIPDPGVIKHWIPDPNPQQWFSQCCRSGRINPDPDAGFFYPNSSVKSTVAYPHHWNANLDPFFHFSANPDPTFHYKSDKPSTAPV
jgi:hypothetical protein